MEDNVWKKVLDRLLKWNFGGPAVGRQVEYSLKKYKRTYQLLEKYDQATTKHPETLAKPGDLRAYIRNFQKKMGVR